MFTHDAIDTVTRSSLCNKYNVLSYSVYLVSTLLTINQVGFFIWRLLINRLLAILKTSTRCKRIND